MDAPSQTSDCVSWASAIKTRIGALQQHACLDLKKNRNSAKRQSESVREKFGKLVEELKRREQELAAALATHSQQTADLDQRQSSLEVFEESVQQLIGKAAVPTSQSESLPSEISGKLAARLSDALPAMLLPSLTKELSARFAELIEGQRTDTDSLPDEVSGKVAARLSDALPAMLLPSLTKELSARFAELIEGQRTDSDSLPDEVSGKLAARLSDALPAMLLPSLTKELSARLAELIEGQRTDSDSLPDEVSGKVAARLSDALPAMLLPSLTKELSARFAELIEGQRTDTDSLPDEVSGKVAARLSDALPARLLPGLTKEVTARLGEFIDGKLAAIDASVQAACRSLAEQLPKSDVASNQLHEIREISKSLDQRQSEIERLRSESLDKQREAEKRSERTTAQRKSIARTLRHQQRALRAEAERIRLSLERAQAMETERSASESAETEQLSSGLTAAQREIAELKMALASSQKEVTSLASQLDDIDNTLAAANQSRESAEAEHLTWRRKLAESEAQLAQVRQSATVAAEMEAKSVAQLLKELQIAKDMRSSLEKQLEEAISELQSSSTASGSSDDHETLIEALRNEINELQAHLALARQAAKPDAANAAMNHETLAQLKRAENDAQDLRTQNTDLASQVAKLQICVKQNRGTQAQLGNEGLSWEERKRLMIQQLEAEADGETPESTAKKLQVEEVIRTTQAEIARRDREIAELRSLVEQQSNARDGVAVGAAAIAQLIESDDFILQERDKIRGIQQEWEQKLRQAEIELSMERAKLGRERAQLEEKLRALEDQPKAHAAPIKSEDGKKEKSSRKWLDRLGLKDDK